MGRCLLNLFLLLGGQFVQMLQQIVYVAICPYEFPGTDFTDALDTGDVVRSVPPDSKYIYHTFGRLDPIIRADFFLVHDINFRGGSFRELVLENVVVYQLTVVLVRSYHVDRGVRSGPLLCH